MAYRRVKDTTTWHWCFNCSDWPTSNYDEKPYQQLSGEYCKECEHKTTVGECQKTEEVSGFQ
ncbi:MAG: hypothetical protein V3T39_08720 [Gammaproteobacteria bacterium]